MFSVNIMRGKIKDAPFSIVLLSKIHHICLGLLILWYKEKKMYSDRVCNHYRYSSFLVTSSLCRPQTARYEDTTYARRGISSYVLGLIHYCFMSHREKPTQNISLWLTFNKCYIHFKDSFCEIVFLTRSNGPIAALECLG